MTGNYQTATIQKQNEWNYEKVHNTKIPSNSNYKRVSRGAPGVHVTARAPGSSGGPSTCQAQRHEFPAQGELCPRSSCYVPPVKRPTQIVRTPIWSSWCALPGVYICVSVSAEPQAKVSLFQPAHSTAQARHARGKKPHFLQLQWWSLSLPASPPPPRSPVLSSPKQRSLC